MSIVHSISKSAGEKLRAILDWNAPHAVTLPLDLSGLYIAVAGNVGIGTTSPMRPLQVLGTSGAPGAGTGTWTGPDGAGKSSVEMGYVNNNRGWIQGWTASGAGTLTLNELGGNVGIGTTSPASQLHVNTSGNEATIRLTAQTSWPLIFNQSSGSLFTISNGGAQRLAIDGNGNVGIGTTSPTSKLQVVGLPVYANNAAAVAGGLTAGAFYRTGADPDPVCVVH